jgi:virginiamycin B lyase
LPDDQLAAYALYVDEHDHVWLSTFAADALMRFDPTAEQFETCALPSSLARIRQIQGSLAEVWAAESGVHMLVAVRVPQLISFIITLSRLRDLNYGH